MCLDKGPDSGHFLLSILPPWDYDVQVELALTFLFATRVAHGQGLAIGILHLPDYWLNNGIHTGLISLSDLLKKKCKNEVILKLHVCHYIEEQRIAYSVVGGQILHLKMDVKLQI